jgi:hypothetical protein
MGCCDKKRSAMRIAPVTRASAPRSVGQAPHREVALRYLRRETIRVRGVGTGRLYAVPADSRDLVVDVRDVPGLLRTGYFSR